MKVLFRTSVVLLFCVFLCTPFLSHASTQPSLERLLYYTDTDSGYASLEQHASQIDILSPQAFTFDATGTLSGGVSDRAMHVVAAHSNIKLMPLVENAHFSTDVIHTILTNDALQNILIGSLVTVGKQDNYWGWQIDIEHMDANDRELFTSFIQKTCTALHAVDLQCSVAVVAKVSDNPVDYIPDSWDEWAGAFDYPSLAQSADFLSVMLYDQADSIGPVSTLSWYNKVLAYATSVVPKDKLSIGIPFYAWEWTPGGTHKVASRTYQYVLDQIKLKTVRSTLFSDTLGTSIMSYTVRVNGTKQKRVLWYENVRSFALKYQILQDAGVRGFSGWAIGQEDARDWTLLPPR